MNGAKAKVSVDWSQGGAPPEAVAEAFSEAALTVAVLDALLEDPELRAKALAALKEKPTGQASEPTMTERAIRG